MSSGGSAPLVVDQMRRALRLAHERRGSFEDIRRREALVAARRRALIPAVAETCGGVGTLRVRRGTTGGPGVIVFAHGGGFVTGSPELCLPLAVRLAESSGCDVVLPRYRLAPEHPAPAAIDDVTAVVVAVSAALRAADGASGGVVLAGCSAGGGIALSAARALRGTDAAPRGLVLTSPWVDLRLLTPTLSRAGRLDPAVTSDELGRCADAYRGPLPVTDPHVSPVLGDLPGLPPALVQVGTDEALHGDAALLTARLRADGVDCELREWPAMIHNWQFFLESLAEAGAAVDEAARWCRERLARPPGGPGGRGDAR
ncbi:alpha/beta hydrolase [Microbispora sp. RL4-1S]|uniref:Alpha/beta hydrolase n=1 Tax=Microbispora oryzae TaxID=2806554 RepID=A0A941AJ26_9ACTN|nr:alpha/beta hydrolase [Microbispora oryzae]MBP2703753.1 alpha/beta hydrolase [Microbispora oryzae]